MIQAYFETSGAFLKVKGDKAASFLHGQLTNTLKDLPIGEGNYNLLLTPKGKVLADAWVYRLAADYFCLITDSATLPVLREHLIKLAPLSRVVVQEDSQKFRSFCIVAPKEQIISGIKKFWGLDPRIFKETGVLLFEPDCHVFSQTRLGMIGLDVFLVPHQVEPVLAQWQSWGLTPWTSGEAELFRIQKGVARVGVDATLDHLPQEAGLEKALHFNKGCYLGQEIIARLHYKGHVNKVLVPLKIEGPVAPQTGKHLLDDQGQVCGVITSWGQDQHNQSFWGLGYVPVKKNQSGVRFKIEGINQGNAEIC